MDIDKQLLEIVREVQQYSIATTYNSDIETKLRKRARNKALTKLIDAIQKSGKLFCRGKSDFPTEVYTESLQETWLYICRNIHKYHPEEGKVMTWVNFIFDKKFKNAIRKYNQEQQNKSLDVVVKEGIILKETLGSPDVVFPEYEELRQFLVEDIDGVFKSRYIQGHPEANFQEIALRRIDGQSWQVMSQEWGISIPTLSCFYQRAIKHFLTKFKEYFEK
ncbi:sigma-70 family RNA polymerase sigma factor [Tolypothrix campylonemoides VB511288]|nr:sigma-70 family RNA polymerase sigma factor [Tolypothrix campylonemoides VB511288]